MNARIPGCIKSPVDGVAWVDEDRAGTLITLRRPTSDAVVKLPTSGRPDARIPVPRGFSLQVAHRQPVEAGEVRLTSTGRASDAPPPSARS